tara:strand:- start:7839 stop:9008 length:1170 start_codon:yes stop_codon:yes gene_type:complete
MILKRIDKMLNTKSICIVTQLFHPNNQAIAVRMKYLADAFIRKGINVSILTSTEQDYRDEQLKLIALKSPIGSNKDGTISRLLKEVITAMEVFIKVLFHRTELFIITSPPFIVSMAAVAACRLKGAKYVFDVRDEYPEVYFAQGLIRETSIIGGNLQKLERWIYNNSILTLTVTDRIVEKIKNRIDEQDKVYLMRNGFTDHIKHIETLSIKPFNVVFHGNMGKFLNPELIVAVAKKCEEKNLPINFHIYGWGVKTSVIIDAMPRLSNLKHLGVVDHENISEVLKTTSIGIAFQGDTELSKNAFPVKIAEYIGAGIPVIVTPKGEVGKFVDDHQVGLQFDNIQVVEIANAIEHFYKNPDELMKFKARTKLLHNTLSRSVISDKFVEQYFQ